MKRAGGARRAQAVESVTNPHFLVFVCPRRKTCALAAECHITEHAIFSFLGARSLGRPVRCQNATTHTTGAVLQGAARACETAWALAAAASSVSVQNFSAGARWFRAPGGNQRLREQPGVAPSNSACIEVLRHHLRNSRSRRLLGENAPRQKLVAPRKHLAHGSAPRGGAGAFGAS